MQLDALSDLAATASPNRSAQNTGGLGQMISHSLVKNTLYLSARREERARVPVIAFQRRRSSSTRQYLLPCGMRVNNTCSGTDMHVYLASFIRCAATGAGLAEASLC